MFRPPSSGQHIPLLATSQELQDALTGIALEVAQAQDKFPAWPADLNYGDQVINEEKGEATQALLDICQGKATIEDAAMEYVQTAAMCVRQIIAIRRFIEERNEILMSDQTLERLMERFLPNIISQVRTEVSNEPVAYLDADGRLFQAPEGLGAAANTLTVAQLIDFATEKQQQVNGLLVVANQTPEGQPIPQSSAGVSSDGGSSSSEAEIARPQESTGDLAPQLLPNSAIGLQPAAPSVTGQDAETANIAPAADTADSQDDGGL